MNDSTTNENPVTVLQGRRFITEDVTSLDAVAVLVERSVEELGEGDVFVCIAGNLDLALGSDRLVDSTSVSGYISEYEDRKRMAREAAANAERLIALQAAVNEYCEAAIGEYTALVAQINTYGPADAPQPRAAA